VGDLGIEGSDMQDARTVFSSEEILASEPGLDPLFAGGVRCHGGFDQDGVYRSPRTVHRMPAIRAWQAALAHDGHPLVGIDRALVPPQFPSLEQAKLLLREGVREPVVRALTLISIVEGFGAVIRDVVVPDLSSVFVEPLEGTALAHLGGGALFEAHARDEAGHRDEGGHKQMWEAARDLAFDKPHIPGDILMRMMGRRPAPGSAGARDRERERAFPEIDPKLERMLVTMANVLVIEVFAARTFDWGEKLLSDPELSARPVEAGAMVGYVRRDEEPHVEYLRTGLSEARARTIRTASGATIAGRTVVDAILHRTLSFITSNRPKEQRENVRATLKDAVRAAGKGDTLLDQFDALDPPWTAPAQTGFEPAS
jgi:hypothetical protein